MSTFVSLVLLVGVLALAGLSIYKLICAIRDRRDAKRKKAEEENHITVDGVDDRKEHDKE